MRFLKGLGGLVLLLVLAPACDSTQPTVLGLRGLTIDIMSINGLMDTFFLYEIHEDLNSNGMADMFLNAECSFLKYTAEHAT